MNPYIIQFNDNSNADFGVILYDYESYSGAAKNYDTIPIAGRDGELLSVDKYKSNLIIEVTFSIFGPLKAKENQLKQWLRGTGHLTFSDNADCFYKVLKINYGTIERLTRRYERFTVSFTCTPYIFLKSGLIPLKWTTMDLNLYNPYSLSKPKYIVTGQSTVNISVNDADVVADVNGELTIDTDLMIAYTNDGTLKNAAIAGDYEQLWLPSGKNKVYISGEGNPTMDIIPNWGWEV